MKLTFQVSTPFCNLFLTENSHLKWAQKYSLVLWDWRQNSHFFKFEVLPTYPHNHTTNWNRSNKHRLIKHFNSTRWAAPQCWIFSSTSESSNIIQFRLLLSWLIMYLNKYLCMYIFSFMLTKFSTSKLFIIIFTFFRNI